MQKIKNLIWIFGFFLYVSFANATIIANITGSNYSGNFDKSSYNSKVDFNGNCHVVNSSIAKYENAIDCRGGGGGTDYFNLTLPALLNESMALCMYVYINETLSSTTKFYYQFGTDGSSNQKRGDENQYSLATIWNAKNCKIDLSLGDEVVTTPNKWTQYCFSYNHTSGESYQWKDGTVKTQEINNCGGINSTIGERITFGLGRYAGASAIFDEVLLINGTLTNSTYLAYYNSIKLGTPKVSDLFVSNIRYNLSLFRNFTAGANNSLNLGVLPIAVELMNDGNTTTQSLFNYTVNIDGIGQICSNNTNLSGGQRKNETCLFNATKYGYGYYKGNITVDVSNVVGEDIETNNVQRLYVSYMKEPVYQRFNLTEFNTILKPYCAISTNLAAYSSCQWISGFTSDSWDNTWVGNDVDPRGNKARENAMNCMYNGYPATSNGCINARNHLFGWGNRTLSSYSDVQAIHELSHVADTFDLMYPNLSQADITLLSREYHDICQWISTLSNTRPDLDNQSLISGGNGWGFGSGMGGFCYRMIGEYYDNPTLIMRLDTQNYGPNIPDSWMHREDSYLQAMKNDTWNQYQEGWLYKTYSQGHMDENLMFRSKFGLIDLNQYQAALCSMGTDYFTFALDYKYNGNSLRGDESNRFRWISRGDTNSYQQITDGYFLGFDVVYLPGYFCNDLGVKNMTMWLREIAYNISESSSTNTYAASYLQKQLIDQGATPISPTKIMPRVYYDNANDILTIRNHTFVNDTVIQIDGGEEKGSGHSFAQGYMIYTYGEPLLDYQQVSYNDDMYSEWWENGISTQTLTQTIEGTGGTFSMTCGNAILNQYYGMSNCPSLSYPSDYPDGRNFPIQYGGDLEDYMGTADGNLAGVYRYQPYKNADDVKYNFIKFGNLMAIRARVSGNTQNAGVQYHLINLQNESNEILSGNNVTFYNGSINLETDVMYSNQSWAWKGGNTTINACAAKNNCEGGNRLRTTYRNRYYNTTANDVDLILAHHWYYTGNRVGLGFINGTDKGLSQGNNNIVYDTDNNGKINTSAGINCTGGCWGLAYNRANAEFAAFNSTGIYNGSNWLWTSNESMEVDMQGGANQIIVTINNMQRRIGIDYPRITTITVNTTFLSNSSGISTKATTFNVTGGQTPVVYKITANSTDYLVTLGGTALGQGTQQEESQSSAIAYSRGIYCGNNMKISFGTGGSLKLR